MEERERDALRAEVEQLRVQLAGCLTAAEGGTSEAVIAREGDYGWSLPYQKILDLRAALDARRAEEQPADPAEEQAPAPATGKLNPRQIVRDCVAACPELEQAPIIDIVTAVIDSAGLTLADIEKELTDAGSMTPNVAALLMGVGAVYEISKQLPGTRGKLVDAGRVVGRAMAGRYRAKIGEAISKRDGGN